ncbi:MAG: TlpA disulfide reductase family protein [Gemmatimonadota bacterium]|jgi:peroxiredoxin
MKRKPYKSPYLWAAVAVVLVVSVAWIGRERYQPVITGTEAPDFAATNMEGQKVHLSDYRGRVVLVNIWATWCGPCRNEMPSMERLYQDLKDTDFEILAVSIDAAAGTTDDFGRRGGDLQAFADELGLTFPILHDPTGKIEQTYQTTGVPETFLIGRDGVIYKKVAGGTDWDAPVNQELVRRLLSE